MYQYATQPLKIREIFSNTYTLWRETLWRTLPLAAIFATIVSIPHFFLPAFNTNHPDRFISELGKIGWPVLIHILIVLFAFLVIFHLLIDAIKGKPLRLPHILWHGLYLLPKAAVAFALIFVSVIGGYILLLIPGIILHVCLAVYIPLLITDKLPLWEAYKRSCDLVWQHWLRTAFVFALSSLFFLTLTAILQWLAHDIGVMINPEGGEIWVLHNIARVILAAFYTPFFAALLLVQLQDLKVREMQAIAGDESMA